MVFDLDYAPTVHLQAAFQMVFMLIFWISDDKEKILSTIATEFKVGRHLLF